MKAAEKQIKSQERKRYKRPVAQLMMFSSEDIMANSDEENLGPWDPQKALSIAMEGVDLS